MWLEAGLPALPDHTRVVPGCKSCGYCFMELRHDLMAIRDSHRPEVDSYKRLIDIISFGLLLFSWESFVRKSSPILQRSPGFSAGTGAKEMREKIKVFVNKEVAKSTAK